MRTLFRIALAVSAMALAAPALAQAVTKFDGNYAGVSRDNLTETTHGECTHGGNSYTLTIANGSAHVPWGTNGALDGTVTQTGALTMRTTSGTFIVHLDGQIDPNGKITAGVSSGSCSYRMIWQKK